MEQTSNFCIAVLYFLTQITFQDKHSVLSELKRRGGSPKETSTSSRVVAKSPLLSLAKKTEMGKPALDSLKK